MGSITSGPTTIFTITVPGVFSAPRQLQGFAADDIFGTDPIESAEIQMGADGVLSGGYVYKEVRQNVTLQADSQSGNVFDEWFAAQQVLKDLYRANGSIILTSIGRKWAMTNGILTSYMPIPDAKRVLQPRRFAITWESVSPSVA